MDKPEKLDRFMKMVIKEIQRNSLVDLLDWWGITLEEYYEIEGWFAQFDVKM